MRRVPIKPEWLRAGCFVHVDERPAIFLGVRLTRYGELYRFKWHSNQWNRYLGELNVRQWLRRHSSPGKLISTPIPVQQSFQISTTPTQASELNSVV